MIQTSTLLGNSLNTYSSDRILCSYTNVTHRIQILRIKNIPDLQLDKVIFPGQILMFEAVPEATLEAQYTDKMSIFFLAISYVLVRKSKLISQVTNELPQF
jgi:hypothetical protein